MMKKLKKIIKQFFTLLKCKARSSIREVAKLIGPYTSSLNAISLGAYNKVCALAIAHNEYDN